MSEGDAREWISITELLWWIISFFHGITRNDVNLLINRLAICMIFNLNNVVMLLNKLLELCCELIKNWCEINFRFRLRMVIWVWDKWECVSEWLWICVVKNEICDNAMYIIHTCTYAQAYTWDVACERLSCDMIPKY